jgi:hypothetical protein
LSNDSLLTFVFRLFLSSREGQQGNVTGPLDRSCQAALVGRAHPSQTPRHNLASLGHKLLQQPDIFVIDVVNFLDAEPANFLATEKLAPLIAASGRSAIAPVAPVPTSRLRAAGFP